jgi:hypothetical protein
MGRPSFSRCSRRVFPLAPRRVALVLAVAASPLVAPAVAGAHLRSGTVAVDYAATLAAPEQPGFVARVFQSDRALSLSVRPGHSVVVLGYLGEPFLRLDDAGVAVNAASPTSVGAGVLPKGDLVGGATIVWRLRRGRHSVVWHDARVQGLPPGVERGSWTVPLLVDGRRSRLTGRLVRYPRPAVWPWLAAAALWIGAILIFALRRRRSLSFASVVLAVGASVAAAVTALGFALDTYASPGTWIAGLDELVFIAVGLGVLAWGQRAAQAPAAIGLGLLAAAIGVSKGAVFLHPIALSLLPGFATRLCVTVSIGAGVAAALLGGASYSGSSAASRRAMPRRTARS